MLLGILDMGVLVLKEGILGSLEGRQIHLLVLYLELEL